MPTFGLTSISRYDDPLLRNEHGWDAPVVLETHPEFIRTCSVGCSVGINENQLALRYPDRQFTLLDTNASALQHAAIGEWAYEHLALDPKEVTIEEIRTAIARMCHANHFDVTRERVKRITEAPNIETVVGSMFRMPFSEDSFDLVLAYNCLQCGISADKFSLSEPYRQMQRVLSNGGHLLNEWGLFKFIGNQVQAVLHEREKSHEYRKKVAKCMTACVQSVSPEIKPFEKRILHLTS